MNAITLWVLIGYAKDTKALAITSVEQLNNSKMPFLMVAEERPTDNAFRVYWLENQGAGPAVKVEGWIEWTEGQESKGTQSIGPTCIGTDGRLTVFYARSGRSPGAFEYTYESLDGERFRTKKDGDGAVSFDRLP